MHKKKNYIPKPYKHYIIHNSVLPRTLPNSPRPKTAGHKGEASTRTSGFLGSIYFLPSQHFMKGRKLEDWYYFTKTDMWNIWENTLYRLNHTVFTYKLYTYLKASRGGGRDAEGSMKTKSYQQENIHTCKEMPFRLHFIPRVLCFTITATINLLIKQIDFCWPEYQLVACKVASPPHVWFSLLDKYTALYEMSHQKVILHIMGLLYHYSYSTSSFSEWKYTELTKDLHPPHANLSKYCL